VRNDVIHLFWEQSNISSAPAKWHRTRLYGLVTCEWSSSASSSLLLLVGGLNAQRPDGHQLARLRAARLAVEAHRARRRVERHLVISAEPSRTTAQGSRTPSL